MPLDSPEALASAKAPDRAGPLAAVTVPARALLVHHKPCLCCALPLLDATDGAIETPVPSKAPCSLSLELLLRQESKSSSLTRSMTSSVSAPSRAIPDECVFRLSFLRRMVYSRTHWTENAQERDLNQEDSCSKLERPISVYSGWPVLPGSQLSDLTKKQQMEIRLNVDPRSSRMPS